MLDFLGRLRIVMVMRRDCCKCRLIFPVYRGSEMCELYNVFGGCCNTRSTKLPQLWVPQTVR